MIKIGEKMFKILIADNKSTCKIFWLQIL